MNEPTDAPNPPEEPPVEVSTGLDQPQEKANSVVHGVGVGFLILLLHIPFVFVPLGFFIAFFPGIAQWLAVVPLAVIWRRAGRRESVKGLLIMAGIVSLANAACCGFLVSSL